MFEVLYRNFGENVKIKPEKGNVIIGTENIITVKIILKWGRLV